jgi:hypothetical protein
LAKASKKPTDTEDPRDFVLLARGSWRNSQKMAIRLAIRLLQNKKRLLPLLK